MTIVGHAVSGWIGFRLFRKQGGRPPIGWSLAALIIPCLPDLDVLGMKLIPYGNLFGHRGLSHSFFAAVVFGVVVALLARRLGQIERSRRGLMMAFVFAASLWASHGVLDAMTTGGKGVALLAPISGERLWLPARVIPVSLLPGDLDASPDRLVQIRDFVMARTSVASELPRRLVGAFGIESVFWSYLAGVVLTELLLLAPFVLVALLTGARAPPRLRAIAALVAAGALAHGIGAAENRRFQTEWRGLEGDTPYLAYEPANPRSDGIVVLLHGWRCSAAMMRPLAETLARNGTRVLVPEIPGHGTSPLPLTLHYDFDAGGPARWREVRREGNAAMLAFLESIAGREARDRRPVALVGHSWGGFLVDELEPRGLNVSARINLEGGSERIAEGRNHLFLGREAWNRIHVPKGRPATPNETHGTFATGSAHELRILPPGGHLGLIRSERVNGEVLRWLEAAFADRLGNDKRDLSGLPWVTAAALAAFALVLVGGRERARSEPATGTPSGPWLGVVLATAVAVRVGVLLAAEHGHVFLWRLAHEQLLLPIYLACIGLPALIAVRITTPTSDEGIAKALLCGGAAWAALFLGAGLYLDASFQHLAIPPGRWLRMAAFSAAAFPLALAVLRWAMPLGPGWKPAAARVGVWTALIAIWAAGQSSGVRAEALQVLLLPVVSEGMALVLARRTTSPWAVASFMALAWGWLWAVSYPVLA
jgi:hypothetical protein